MARLIVKDLPAEEVILNAETTVEIVGGTTTPKTGGGSDHGGGDTLGSDGLSYMAGHPVDQKEPTGGWWENFVGLGDTGWSTL